MFVLGRTRYKKSVEQIAPVQIQRLLPALVGECRPQVDHIGVNERGIDGQLLDAARNKQTASEVTSQGMNRLPERSTGVTSVGTPPE